VLIHFDTEALVRKISEAFRMSPSSEAGLTAVLGRVRQDSFTFASLPQLAYFLATVKWETGHTFRPMDERGPVGYFSKYDTSTQAGIKIGNTQPGDGSRFKARGYIPITGRSNYAKFSKVLGVDLTENPERACDEKAAYQIAALGMHDGVFTGDKLDDYLHSAGTPNYVSARRIVNGSDHADDIAKIARDIEPILTACCV